MPAHPRPGFRISLLLGAVLSSTDGAAILVRTGATAIFPRGKTDQRGVFAGFFAGNGNGDMTGTHWVEEGGVLETPILITGTGSVAR